MQVRQQPLQQRLALRILNRARTQHRQVQLRWIQTGQVPNP